MQETDELRLSNLYDMVTVLASDIKLLREYYLSLQKELLDTLVVINDMKYIIDLVKDHDDFIQILDSRVKVLEEFKDLINPDMVIKLSEDVETLKTKVRELDNFYNEIDRQLSTIDAELTERLDDVDTALTLINTRLDELFIRTREQNEQLTSHENSINNLYSNIDSILNRLLNLEDAVSTAESAILELQDKSALNDLWHNEMNNTISVIEQNVSNNTLDINNLKLDIPRINERLNSIDSELEKFDDYITEMQEGISSLENRVSNLEEQALTFATKALVNSLALEAHIKEEEELITIKLILDGESLSSIDIPFFVKKEEEKDRIARTMNAWTNYSITAIGNETIDTTARVDKGTTDYSTTN